MKNLFKNYSCLIGSSKDLFSIKFQKAKYSDPIFISLYHYDRIHSHYPKKILIRIVSHHYDYLYRKKLGLPVPHIKDGKQAREYFYELCNILDDIDKKKQG